MNSSNAQTAEQTATSALADPRTLSILIARIRFFATAAKDRKHSRPYHDLVSALEKLSKLQTISQCMENSSDVEGTAAFIDGIPRWVMQAESQFLFYVNPPSKFRIEWAGKRSIVWNAIESTVPQNLRETLLSWRWRAELLAFRQIIEQLTESQKKLRLIEEKLEKEEKRGSQLAGSVGWFDRIRILRWSKNAAQVESEVEFLEQEKQRKIGLIGELVDECERLAALLAMEMKSSFSDCGNFYSTIFEECTRVVDNEIKKELSEKLFEIESENGVLEKVLDERMRAQKEASLKKNTANGKINRVLNSELERKICNAQELIQSEFLCLNSMEIEHHEEARNRWKYAVENMKDLLHTAEENLLHVRGVD